MRFFLVVLGVWSVWLLYILFAEPAIERFKKQRDRMRVYRDEFGPELPPFDPRCPYCKGTTFYEGPSGGISVNVMCANDFCQHWFNATPFSLDDLHEVGPNREAVKL